MSNDTFFGELYLRSTRPFLSPEVTEAEVAFLIDRFEGRRPLLDVGCGHGRHVSRVPGAVGVDRDWLSLQEANRRAPVAQGDLRSLPFAAGVFRGAWCWYNSLGTFEDDQVPLILTEVARCLEPGGRFIIQGSNRARAEGQPEAGYDGPLAEGEHLRETARYSAERKRDEIRRTLTLEGGRVLEADFFIRYYDVEEWRGLLDHAGFTLEWTCASLDGAPFTLDAADLVVGATKR